ncbi:protein FAM151B isoform X2 [Oratosquilla oratoria]|uniref:protein FAM151B isoform X2 n=1 Tax=Oratosquilla oratoria TaxID=337810 RepID=UPI003F76DCA5
MVCEKRRLSLSLRVIVIFALIFGVQSEIMDVIEFFPDLSADVSNVTWAHACNSRDKLREAIQDHKIMMLEADVSEGRVVGETDTHMPIMAHPPYVTSQLSLAMWIDEVIKANEEGKQKGVKLDFKDLSIVELSMETLTNRSHLISFPLWLNADILRGPVEISRPPLNPDKFLTLCSMAFPTATLSVGWTTKYVSANDPRGAYTQEMMKEMCDVLERNNIAQPITFPIRAAFVNNSLDTLEWLAYQVPDSTITVWSAETDSVDMQGLVALRNNIGHDVVYYDLPEEQQKAFEAAKFEDEYGISRGAARSSVLFNGALKVLLACVVAIVAKSVMFDWN